MWFGILGHLAVRRADGADVPIPGPARRQVLAALLCRPGAIVTTATLVEDLWGSAPPRSAVNSLHSHIVRLRAALAQGADVHVLLTVGDGYRLDVAHGDIDAGRFEALVDEAGRMSDASAAIERYDQALALWRDEPYVEFGDAPFAVLERIRLAELRALARERRTDLVLASGARDDLIGELEQRVRAEPYRERGWEQLALALYRAGRQADALSTCRRARRTLQDDLGVDPGPDLQTLEQQLLRHDPQLLAPSPPRVGTRIAVLDRCPYLGLAGYEEQDAALFVGRERLTSTLAGRLADQSVVVVTGASGVGKSSLVRAGLIPALRSGALPGSSAWRIDVRTPDAAVLADAPRRPDLLVLDQAEELFTGMDSARRDDLLHRLARYVEDEKGRLLLVLRSDFYGRLADLAALAPYAESTAVLVGPMRADELRRALVEPAARTGLRLEDELIETILDDVAGQPEPLPLLSEAMVRTWQRRDGNLLTLDGYEASGELAGALEAAAEECFTALNAEEQRAARRVLVRLAARTDTGWARRPAARSDFVDGAEERALGVFVSARLLVSDERHVQISHEALLVHWPRLREWLDERSLAGELLQHLEHAASSWQASGRQDADLYRGPRLAAASDWRAEHPEDLSSTEREFLDASARLADAELEEARAQAAREARGRRNVRRVAVALSVVVVLAVAGGVVALYERSTARHEASRAEQAALSADSRRLAALAATAPDIATSSLLAVAAYRLQDSPDSRGALLNAVERNQSALWRLAFAHRPQRIVANPDGTRIAVNDPTNVITVIDPRSRRQVASFPADGWVEGITADGTQVITEALPFLPHAGRLAVWDVTRHTEHVLTDASDASGAEPVTADNGRWVAAVTTEHVGNGQLVDVFDARDWTAPPAHFVTTGPPLAMGAGRSVLAVEHSDGSVELRSLPSLRRLGTIPAAAGNTGPPLPLAVSPDGKQLARVNLADPLRAVIYSLAGAAPAATPLPSQPQSITALAFAPDGSALAVGSQSGSLNVYRTSDGDLLSSFAGHAGGLHGIAWTGETSATRAPGLYTVGLDGQLISWDLDRGPRTIRQSGPDRVPATYGHAFGSVVIGYAADLGIGGPQVAVYTLDLRAGRYATWPAGFRDGETSGQIVASDDGRLGLVSIIAYQGKNAGQNRIEIVDLRRHRDIGHLALPPGTSYFVDSLQSAITRDGRYAYCALGRDRIGVFALPSGRYLRSFTVHFADPGSKRIELDPSSFDPRGRLLVYGYDPSPVGNQRFGLVDVTTQRLVAQVGIGDIGFPDSPTWSHDGRLLAFGTSSGTVQLLDAVTLAPRADTGVVTAGYASTVSFAPDDKTLVSAGTDASLNFWTVPDLRPEGGRVVLGNGSNGGVRAWYAPDGDVVGLAPDLREPNSTRQRWFDFEAEPAELAEVACQLAGSDLTRAQWQRYVGDRPYQRVCSG